MNLASFFSRKSDSRPLINQEGAHVQKYNFFRTFLEHNRNALSAIADLEQAYYSGKPLSLGWVWTRYQSLREAALGTVYSLASLNKRPANELETVLAVLDRSISSEMEPVYKAFSSDLILPFEQIRKDNVPAVGAKAANLARIGNKLSIPVPAGFAVTTSATEQFLTETELGSYIERRLAQIESGQGEKVDWRLAEIRAMVLNAPLPAGLSLELRKAYRDLEKKTHPGVRVAVRSSAVGEDTEAAFAGQYDTVLNVTESGLADAYKHVIASKYSSRAIAYRLHTGLSDRDTPMAVAVVVMVDPKASGVMYTTDLSADNAGAISISSVWGLAEQLVGGGVSPDVLVIDRASRSIRERRIGKREKRMTNLAQGGTALLTLTETEQGTASLDDATALQLAEYGLRLEMFFGAAQDVEWAVDESGSLFILQSRPLGDGNAGMRTGEPVHLAGRDALPINGKTASPGIAAGPVVILQEGVEINSLPEGAVLVARTASPNLTKYAGKVSGIITDIGSAASHLASVAREFGVPAIVDAGNATSLLHDGDIITMTTNPPRVYAGRVEELARRIRPGKRPVHDSPLHRRLRRALDKISPLNLVDPADPSFSPEGCRSIHDVIRYTHEKAMHAMFGLTDEADAVRSIELKATIPLELRLVDLGGGLKQGLTTTSDVTPASIESVPFQAIWKGFTHPGVSWEGGIGVTMNNMLTLITSSTTSEVGQTPGGVSYAILSSDYMNLSLKFGYHFATLDALVSEISSQNYISLQFSGGAGNYYGKSLRIAFLGNVLGRLGFHVTLKGDLLEGAITDYDRPSLEEKLDKVGRLFASSRLLDMAISKPEDVERMTEDFFRGNYDYLGHRGDDDLEHFYTHGGLWTRAIDDGLPACMQDGSRAGFSLSSGVVGLMEKVAGHTILELLDNIEAYFYFPLAVAKKIRVADGSVSLHVKPVGGNIDRAGGLAFGMKDVGNYFVLRVNALEDNIILFEYVNSRRIERARARAETSAGRWYQLKVHLNGDEIQGFLNDSLVLEYRAESKVQGFVGLWTKADSVTLFRDLVVETGGSRKEVCC
ncbi:MAG TPA: PEP/pyruvate-binding domain-containing protein [Nitrospirota bacterium]|nr:PEP/pyruvate-binding domain-containing protein [Nitrospirota bacterium]